jgi:hypothetical protein
MIKFVEQDVAQARYNVCKLCPEFNTSVMTCKECKCFMKLKVKLVGAECPLKKW